MNFEHIPELDSTLKLVPAAQCAEKSVYSKGGASEGGRNDANFHEAVRVRRAGGGADAVLDAVQVLNQKHSPPQSDAEVVGIVDRVLANVEAGNRAGGGSEAVPAFVGGILTAEEALADEIPDALIEGLAHPHSISTFTGASKTGKSILVTQLTMGVATGTAVLGFATRRARVLYISLEMTAALMIDRMKAIERDTGTPLPDLERDFLLWAPTAKKLAALDLLRESAREKLRDVIREFDVQLVVLDTLYRFALGADPNSNAEMQPLFADISDIAQKTGAAIIVIDHAGKGQHEGPVSHSAIGASIKGGASRTIVALKREGNGWTMNVESHFGNWDSAITYTRPTRDDGSKGFGCVRSSPAEVRGIDLEAVRRVFHRHGEREGAGDPLIIPSQRKLITALQKEGLLDSESLEAGQKAASAVESTYGCDHAADSSIRNKYPVWVKRGGGRGRATQYHWIEAIYREVTGVTGVTG